MLAIRVLYEFAGAFHDALPVVDPATGAPLPRTTIVDPRTGGERGRSSAARRVCGRARDRLAASCAARPVVDAAAAAQDSGHRRRIHRLRHPERPDRGQPARHHALRGDRRRRACATSLCRPATAISACRAPTTLPGKPAPRAMDRRVAARRRRCPRTRANCATSCTPPTSGTASSATGARRRSVCSSYRHPDGQSRVASRRAAFTVATGADRRGGVSRPSKRRGTRIGTGKFFHVRRAKNPAKSTAPPMPALAPARWDALRIAARG